MYGTFLSTIYIIYTYNDQHACMNRMGCLWKLDWYLINKNVVIIVFLQFLVDGGYYTLIPTHSTLYLQS